MEPLIKKRKLTLRPDSGRSDLAGMVTLLQDSTGILDIRTENGSAILVEYDLMKTDLLTIEKILQAANQPLKDGMWNRFIRGWIHFMEENERQNMRTSSKSCCSSG